MARAPHCGAHRTRAGNQSPERWCADPAAETSHPSAVDEGLLHLGRGTGEDALRLTLGAGLVVGIDASQ
jgi:hypothetical protein